MFETASISINFMNELKDHIEAQRFLYRHSLMAKLDKVIAILLFAFGVYCITYVGLYWWTAIWFPLAVVEWFNLLSLNNWRAKMDFQRNAKYREEYCLTFSSSNIYFKTASIDSTIQWDLYKRVAEGSDFFLLIYGKNLYTLVPKRCFKSKEEMDAFHSLVLEKIPR